MAGMLSDDMLCAEAEGTKFTFEMNQSLFLSLNQSDENFYLFFCPGKDSCQGDSGGPFTVDVEGRNSVFLQEVSFCQSPQNVSIGNFVGQHHLVGVVSWGLGCAKVSPSGSI